MQVELVLSILKKSTKLKMAREFSKLRNGGEEFGRLPLTSTHQADLSFGGLTLGLRGELASLVMAKDV